MLDLDFENQFRSETVKYICGTDEAGRGPLAGPVVAGACILPEGLVIKGLDDSKKLSEKRREALQRLRKLMKSTFSKHRCSPCGAL